MAQAILDRLAARLGGALLEQSCYLGNEAATVVPEALVEAAHILRSEPKLAMDMPIDCTAVDWWHKRTPRYEVVWHLYSVQHGHRVRLRVRLDDPQPSCPSLTPMWPGFNWHEREAWDLYGIRFEDHPNLKRILMYEEFRGHPLRKDYPVDGRQPLIEMLPVTRAVPTQRQAPPEMLNRP